MKRFNRALVTGASKGLGIEIVKKLAERVDHLVLVARDEKAMLELKEKLQKDYSFKGEIDIISVDLTQKEAIEKIEQYSKPIDLLVNNAGLGFVNEFENMTRKEIDQMIMVNNYALTMLSHHFYSQMAKVNNGQIINIASVAGFFPMPLFTVYAATKVFVISFSRALDAESKNNVRVKALCPGGIKTNFHLSAGMTNRIADDNKNFMETPESIASDVMRLIDGNSDVLVPKYYNKLVGVLAKIIPTPFLMSQSKEMYKKYIAR